MLANWQSSKKVAHAKSEKIPNWKFQLGSFNCPFAARSSSGSDRKTWSLQSRLVLFPLIKFRLLLAVKKTSLGLANFALTLQKSKKQMQMVAIVLLTVIKYYFINFVNFRLWILIPSIKRWSFSSPRWSISWSVTSQKQDLFLFQQHFGGVFFRKQNGFPQRQVRIRIILWPNLITSMYAFSWKSCWRRRNYIWSACAGTSNRYFGNWSFVNQAWILKQFFTTYLGISIHLDVFIIQENRVNPRM